MSGSRYHRHWGSLASAVSVALVAAQAAEDPEFGPRHLDVTVYFYENESALVHAGRTLLQHYEPIFQEGEGFIVHVEGHADEAERNGDVLSSERAIVVARALYDQGVDPETIRICSRGAHWPFTEYGSQASFRRVEVTFDHQQPNDATGSCRGDNVRWLGVSFE